MYTFILGTGCCGSKLVYEVLARHPDVAFVSNLDDRLFWADLRGRFNGPLYRSLRRNSSQRRLRFIPSEGYRLLDLRVSPVMSEPTRTLTPDETRPEVVERLRSFFTSRAATQGSRVFLHKFTGCSRAELLQEAFPDARFIHVVRDGRAVASSLARQPWWTGERGVGRSWAQSPDLAPFTENWEMSLSGQLMLAGHAWRAMMETHERSERMVSAERWLTVRYEDVLDDPEGYFVRMLEHAEVENPERVLKPLTSYPVDRTPRDRWRRLLPAEQVTELNQLLGPMLTHHGYSLAGTLT